MSRAAAAAETAGGTPLAGQLPALETSSGWEERPLPEDSLVFSASVAETSPSFHPHILSLGTTMIEEERSDALKVHGSLEKKGPFVEPVLPQTGKDNVSVDTF